MRVAFVYNEVPNREHSTDSYCAYLLLQALREAGHELTAVLLLSEQNTICDAPTRERWLRDLEQLRIDVHRLPGDPAGQSRGRGLAWASRLARQLVFPQLADYFPHVRLAQSVRACLLPLSPDLVFVWGNWPPLAATHGIEVAPRFAFMGDPPHMPQLFRSRPPLMHWTGLLSPRHWAFRLKMRHLARLTNRLLSSCQSVAATAAHHAEWFSRNGVGGCKYLPNIVPDWGGENWAERRRNAPRNGKLRIAHLGHVEGTATRAGLHLLATETLPTLERELGEGFEVHIYGKGRLSPEVEKKLQRPSVHVRGFVDDIVSELLRADVFIVPTPIELGIRVRIPYAWSVGCCVVAHRANAAGLPELEHERNALLAASGKGLAHEIARLYYDPDLREKLGYEGRRTYETAFSHQVTTRKILREIEALASAQGVST